MTPAAEGFHQKSDAEESLDIEPQENLRAYVKFAELKKPKFRRGHPLIYRGQDRVMPVDNFLLPLYPHARFLLRHMWVFKPGFMEQKVKNFTREAIPSQPITTDGDDPAFPYAARTFGLFAAGFKTSVNNESPVNENARDLAFTTLDVLKTAERVVNLVWPAAGQHHSFGWTSSHPPIGDTAPLCGPLFYARSTEGLENHTPPAKIAINVISPWALSSADMHDMITMREFPAFGRNPDGSWPQWTRAHKVWAQIQDCCIKQNCPFFILTTYEYWIFGSFHPNNYSQLVCTTTVPYTDSSPSILEWLVFWCASALKIPGSWNAMVLYVDATGPSGTGAIGPFANVTFRHGIAELKTMSTSTATEKLREFCIRLESGQNVENEATSYLENECKDFQADLEMELEVNALANLLTSRLYTRITDDFLREATTADDEASWWSYLEQSSHFELTWYLLQTLPHRLYRIVIALRESAAHRTGSTLLATFFPHLSLHKVRYLPFSPFHHLRNECMTHRLALESLRDDTAEKLGKLVLLQPINFSSSLPALCIITGGQSVGTNDAQAQKGKESFSINQPPSQLLRTLDHILKTQKHTFHSLLTPHLKPSTLTLTWPKLILVPSITFILFRMVYTPSSSSNMSTYSMLKATFFQIQSTAVGFWRNYLLEPLREILDTMRTGGSESTRLVNPQGVQADVESLHRMAISLTKDTYPHLIPSEVTQAHTPALDELTAQIMSGDLTPVLKIYENDLRAPLRSALTGSLIRSLLIQVQRMKVDLSTTLQSLDKLLHSQALTFALVGVAPSLVITYSLLSALKTFIVGANRQARFGGAKKRRVVWSIIRRIERILVYSETISQNSQDTANNQQNTLPPLAQGHLLISLSHLRTFAHNNFPPYSYSSPASKPHRNSPPTELEHAGSNPVTTTFSQIQKHSHRTEQNALAAFLSDIDDLSDPVLGRDAKLRVVDRMWRSWGALLGWGEMGGESGWLA